MPIFAAVTLARLFSNAEVFEADLGKIVAITLIHRHSDHFLGLVELLKLLYK